MSAPTNEDLNKVIDQIRLQMSETSRLLQHSREEIQRLRDERNSLHFQLEMIESMRMRDNQSLIKQRDELRAEVERLREALRDVAERQREACAEYLRHWTYDEHDRSRVRATPLVTEEKTKPALPSPRRGGSRD